MNKANLNAILEELSKEEDNQTCFDCSKSKNLINKQIIF